MSADRPVLINQASAKVATREQWPLPGRIRSKNRRRIRRRIKVLFSHQTLLCVLRSETFEVSTLNLDTKAARQWTGLINQ